MPRVKNLIVFGPRPKFVVEKRWGEGGATTLQEVTAEKPILAKE